MLSPLASVLVFIGSIVLYCQAEGVKQYGPIEGVLVLGNIKNERIDGPIVLCDLDGRTFMADSAVIVKQGTRIAFRGNVICISKERVLKGAEEDSYIVVDDSGKVLTSGSWEVSKLRK